MDSAFNLGLKRIIYFWVLIGCIIVNSSAGPVCYVCSGTGPGSNCELDPAKFEFGPGTVNCSAEYCSAVKVIKKDTKETDSFARLCDSVDRGNWCFHDANFITCYLTCRHDYCNHGNPNHSKMRDYNGNDVTVITERSYTSDNIPESVEVNVGDQLYNPTFRSTSHPPTIPSVYETVIERPVTRANYVRYTQTPRMYVTSTPRPSEYGPSPRYRVNKYYEHRFSSPLEEDSVPRTRIVKDNVIYIDDGTNGLRDTRDRDDYPEREQEDRLDVPLMELLAPLLDRDKTEVVGQKDSIRNAFRGWEDSSFNVKPIIITGYHDNGEQEAEIPSREIRVDDIIDRLKGTADDYELLNLRNHVKKMRQEQDDTQLTKPPTVHQGTMQKQMSDGPFPTIAPSRKRIKRPDPPEARSKGHHLTFSMLALFTLSICYLMAL